jgi:hypothetical protein
MKSFAVVIAIAVLGVTGFCRADDRAAVGAPSRALKVVLYEFSGQQFAGSVVWHTDSIVSNAGQPPAPALRADIEIPNLGMTVRTELRRNDDDAMPASHTVELVFTLPPDFVHGGIAAVPGLLMKAGETALGVPLNGVSVKVAENFFLIGLSNDDVDRQRNVELLKERPWLDVPIVYGDGRRAILAIEKASWGERALAVLDAATVEPTPTRQVPAEMPQAKIEPAAEIPWVPIDHLLPGAVIRPWPISDASPSERYAPLNQALKAASEQQLAALPSVQPREPIHLKLSLPVLERPTWAWPPGNFWWAVAPGLPSASRTWRAGWQPALPEMIRIASRIEVPPALRAILPPWVQDTSMAMVTTESLPPWPRLRAPDFRLPTGPSRFAATSKYLEPPAQFVRWSDRIETLLPFADWREVDRRCRALVGKLPPPGKFLRGCAHSTAGRCFITRVDDPGVARHELAHCNGWKHPE